MANDNGMGVVTLNNEEIVDLLYRYCTAGHIPALMKRNFIRETLERVCIAGCLNTLEDVQIIGMNLISDYQNSDLNPTEQEFFDTLMNNATENLNSKINT